MEEQARLGAQVIPELEALRRQIEGSDAQKRLNSVSKET